ncbi:hypothetical protein FV232_01000 [Methylobacterium sp. WL30]|uniref:hypothetical protein n=1 Tax=unclassified Methylobacterium TaxID=2615210 RepID=UPI0011C8543A|nr:MULTISPECIES: hypothetical protein [unclassified Methylobacterium]TXN38967.1 hypothetical protein FV225_11600 [Methylobacterium sp. WL93]TXN52254.1 hypothetical protein FV227_04170 [Methylobacterium sp. WL119]TXN70663.1 hypothetical protein FV232_01000 [Methylobacterium sp. WL30]
MSLQQTIDTLASDVKLSATVTMQTAALAAATAVSVKAIGETVAKLAADKGINTTAADASLEGLGEHLSALVTTTGQTGATLPGTDAAPAAGAATGSTSEATAEAPATETEKPPAAA